MHADPRTRYRAGLGLALLASLFMLWLIPAVGIIGVEGDGFDLVYLGVLALGIGGAVVARLRPEGMERAMLTMVAALAVIAVIALVAGKHRSPATSVLEVLGLNGMFAILFGTAAWLFRSAAQASPTVRG
ncbi:MAG TPA: hypothetical protein VK906_11600 [Egicoccus sp.]|nr:hypothetical protein [Egicoccus sp.]HSK23817.1 hypothetical protein [Egicoccus sp.]